MMEVAEPAVYASETAHEEKSTSCRRRWQKLWMPQDTVLGNGKCFLLRWTTEDALSVKSASEPVEEDQETAAEHETVYVCKSEGCGKVFPEASGLRKHAHVHGEKQFICGFEGCGKRFVDSSKLKRHYLIHTGEKDFVCKFEGCGKAFSLDFNLRSHMRTHTGENYHICPFSECGKRYAHEYKLKAHLKSYHDKNGPESNMLSLHPDSDRERDIAVPPRFLPAPAAPPVAVEKPFVCPYEGCTKRYIHEYKLNLHLKSTHANHGSYEEAARQGRGSEGEDDIEEVSDQEMRDYEDPVQRFHEQPKVSQVSAKKRKAPKAPPKGKSKVVEKPPPKIIKKKRKAEPTIKINIKSPVSVRNVVPTQESPEDSEETEDENENTEEEDNVQFMSRRIPREEDDEETEDDMQ